MKSIQSNQIVPTVPGWEGSSDLGRVQLVRSSLLPRLFHPLMFSPRMHILRWHCQDSTGIIGEELFREHETSFRPDLLPHWECLGPFYAAVWPSHRQHTIGVKNECDSMWPRIVFYLYMFLLNSLLSTAIKCGVACVSQPTSLFPVCLRDCVSVNTIYWHQLLPWICPQSSLFVALAWARSCVLLHLWALENNSVPAF